MGDSAPEVTRAVAAFLAASSFDDLPDAVIDKAELCILDTIGCSLAGALTRRGGIVRSLALPAESGCCIIGGGHRTSPLEAAFCNAMTANALELDDTFDRPGSIMFAHPGATVVPAALSAAELMGSSGAELIHAVVLGYEVCLRVGVAVQPTRKRAFEEVWGGATFQTLGAVAAAAKLCRLDLDRTMDALGIAGATAPAPAILKVWRADHPDLHNAYGWAAEAGLRAALLASHGYTAPRDILDGNNGFWRICGSDQCQFDVFTQGLGERYWIEEVSFKPWAACRWAHPIMDAAKAVTEENDIHLRDMSDVARVEEITVRTFNSIIRSPYDNRRPINLLSGQFSTPFCTAAALLGLQPSEDLFAGERVADPRIEALMSKVTLACDPEAERLFPGNGGSTLSARVELRFGGRSYASHVRHPWGDPRNPMRRADLEAKLIRNAQHGAASGKLDTMIEVLRGVRNAKDLRMITPRLM